LTGAVEVFELVQYNCFEILNCGVEFDRWAKKGNTIVGDRGADALGGAFIGTGKNLVL
jgi:hypothetical protein